MASTNLIQVAARQDFQERCRLLFISAALSVMAEDPGTADHANRAAFAGAVLFGKAPILQMTYAILSNAAIAAAIEADPSLSGDKVPDGDMQFQANSVFGAFSDALATVTP